MAVILIVDDHAANRELVVSLAEHRGHEAREASTGVEALRMARERRPNLVILDINMPAMGGEEFVRRLRADPALASIEVAFYTASHDQSAVRELARAVGVTRILAKPADPVLVLRLLDEALGRPPADRG